MQNSGGISITNAMCLFRIFSYCAFSKRSITLEFCENFVENIVYITWHSFYKMDAIFFI